MKKKYRKLGISRRRFKFSLKIKTSRGNRDGWQPCTHPQMCVCNSKISNSNHLKNIFRCKSFKKLYQSKFSRGTKQYIGELQMKMIKGRLLFCREKLHYKNCIFVNQAFFWNCTPDACHSIQFSASVLPLVSKELHTMINETAFFHGKRK